jgi:uncharacterized membrane protein
METGHGQRSGGSRHETGQRANPPEGAGAVADNIRAIVEIEQRAARQATRSERISDAISGFAGSMTFVIIHVTGFTAWAGWNVLAPPSWQFDPYPFGLLTLIVSAEAVLVSTFVLIAQNRIARQSSARDNLDLQIDLLAEQEMTMVLRMLRRVSDRLGIAPETEDAARTQRLSEPTDVQEVMETIRQEEPKHPR